MTFLKGNLAEEEAVVQKVFCEKGVLRNFAKFARKHLRQGLFFDKVAGLSLQLY